MTDAASLKAHKAKRGQIKSSLTRVQTYLAELNVPERLQKATDLWGFFDETQGAIEELEPEEENQASHQAERTTFENRYFAITVQLETLINRKVQAALPPQQSHYSVQNVPSHREGTPYSQASNFPNEHLKLPRINLLTFAARYEQWIPFRNMFQSMIHENPTLPSVQKMQYLISSLTDEAKDVVSSLEASEENYIETWRMLKERYDDDSLIIQKHVKELFDQPVLLKENHLALRKMLDNVLKHIRALRALKRPTSHWDDLLIHLVTSRLDQTTSKEWETTIKRGEIPTFTQLVDFLTQRCRALEASARTPRDTFTNPKGVKSDKNKGTSVHVATSNIMCSYCGKEDHFIYKCSQYLELDVDHRIKEARSRKLCLNCLKATNHQAKQCGSGSCRKCNKRHNTLLHLEQASKQQESTMTKTAASPSKTETVVATSINHAAIKQERHVILATAVVDVFDAEGDLKPCRVLLDNGSQSCFITSDCVKKLGLKPRPTNIPIFGVGESSTQTRAIVKVKLRSRINAFQAELDCLVIEKITQSLPIKRLKLHELKIPEGITLADPNFSHPSEVDLLLGAEIFLDLLCIGKIKISNNQPIWQKTLFGWIVSGTFMSQGQAVGSTVCKLAVSEQLSSSITRFWQLESIERQNTRTPEERICEAHFASTYKRNAQGRFVITLPTKQDKLPNLGESRDIAINRFKVLERKLERKLQLKKDYSDFMHEYLDLQHMRQVQIDGSTDDVSAHYYLPHHCVMKQTSTTTRLRVVFDASSKTTRGLSLNDVLMVGPVLQQELFSILLRFRTFEYALTGDIAKMYRQILVDDDQTPLQRIVWRDHPSDDIKTYELLTLTYGTAPASFIATRVIHQLATMEEVKCPKGAMIARRDFYVDDLITGANTKEEALIIRNQITELLHKGGFTLRKWASNDQDLLQDIAGSSISSALLELDKDGISKTLGIRWNPAKDVFQYAIAMEEPESRYYTKRSILSSISQIFDPLGLLGPVIITAKIIIQKLWKLQLDWDESLPTDVHTEWSDYIIKMQELNRFSVQRKVISVGTDIQLDLHGFCDASERAYGACIYICSKNSHGVLQSQLLCSKSRVAPLKTISIPRLELCGAQLLSQLMHKVKGALELNIHKECYWTDSSIVLHWIKAANKKLPVFVAHRIREIQEFSSVEDWNHVRTRENPADLISRGVTPKELAGSTLWWQGPVWLQSGDDLRCSSEIMSSSEIQLDSFEKPIIAMSIQD